MQTTLAPDRNKSGRNSPYYSKTIVSFYMDNIPTELVEMQKAMLDEFALPEFKVKQIKTFKSHSDSLDEFMKTTDSDIVLFLDIDCVPLHSHALIDLATYAERGELAGCVQRANHIENGNHLYVGPFCMALSRALWIELGSPSFKPTERGDVGEEITYLCEARSKPVHMIWPSAVEEPMWELAPNVKFGFNTEYSRSFLHTFGIRHGENRHKFIERCRVLLAGAENKASGTYAPAKAEQSNQVNAPAARALHTSTKSFVPDGPGPLLTFSIAAHDHVSLGTDKEFWHRYTESYDRAFATLGEVNDILEFGVLNGDSIRWLAGRFPEARIVGADIIDQRPGWPISERIQYVQVDQSDRAAIRRMFNTLDRKYDLVIEDGSHIPQHQAACLIEGLPFVRPQKLYIVEDIHTSHPDNVDFHQYNSPGIANSLHILLAIEHLKHCGQELTSELAATLASPGFCTTDEVRCLFAQISTLELYRRSSLPLRCYRCGTNQFDYKSLRCTCGADLYSAADSMAFLIQRA